MKETALYQALERASIPAIQNFVDRANSKDDELHEFCFRGNLPIPVPDEVVLMQTMYHNLEAARSHLALIKGSGSKSA